MSTAPQLAGQASSGPRFWSANTPQLSIDSNGNLITKAEGTDTWTYEWDAENRLKRVLKNAAEVARFAYDPLGRRVQKVTGSVTTSYAYDGHGILRETTSVGTNLTYVHGPAIDEPLAHADSAGALTYFHADGLGSIVRTTNASGAVVTSRQYDPFGTLEVGATSGYSYTSREWDSQTNLYYYRARYVDPSVGRFISEDPLQWLAGPNFFAYVSNNPIRWTDPLGLMNAATQSPIGDIQLFMLCAQAQKQKYGTMSAGGAPQYAHCLTSCGIKKFCGAGGNPELRAVLAGYGKEILDMGDCLRTGNPRSCYTAMQPSDIENNAFGRSCPMETSCIAHCEPLRTLGENNTPGPFYRWPFVR